jgi:hypothetical protein
MPNQSAAMHLSTFLSGHAQYLRRTPWLTVLGKAWLLMVGCALVKPMLPRGLGQALRPLVWLLPLLVLVAKDMSHLPDALARIRVLLAARAWSRLPAAWLPPELVGLFRLDSALRRGFVHWLRRCPHAALPAGQAFGYLERGAYGTVVAIVLFSLLVEIPLDAFIASFFVHDPVTRRVLHAVLLAGALSSLAWVLGDRWWIGAGRHVLDADSLHLRVGARSHGSIARSAIAACERVDVPAAAWCRARGIAPHAALVASPFDRPNAVLMLEAGNSVCLQHLGRARTGLACVFLYIDRPDLLAGALRRDCN